MKLHYIKRPVYVERSAYDATVSGITQYLAADNNVKSVYQFGSVSIPGISDIDMLIVFKNDTFSDGNGFKDDAENYLFTHGIMAVCEDHFYKNHHYTLWSDYILKGGE